MTGLQFQIKFLQKLQNHIGKDLDIRTIDIQYYMDRGRELYVDEIIQKYRGQEEYRKRLGNLLQTVSITRPVAPNVPEEGIRTNGEIWDISTLNARHIIDEFVSISGVSERIPVKPVTNDYYNKQSKNPFKSPYNKGIWRMDVGEGKHELIAYTASGTITNYFLTYIKHPALSGQSGFLDVTDKSAAYTEIPVGFQNEIVDKAVLFALEVFQISGSLRTNTAQQ